MDGLYLGIAGGGSKTGGVLLDRDGTVLSVKRVGGSAIRGRPAVEALTVLTSLAQALCAEAQVPRSAVQHYGIGINGVDFADEQPMQHRAVAASLDIEPERLTLVNDGIVALWGATPAPASAHWQHGSAFTGAYRAAFGKETMYGNLNVGRAFDIRGQALALVARMIDGRAQPTALMDLMLEHLDVAAADYHETVHGNRIANSRMLLLGTLVFDAFEAGEPAAEQLVRQAIDDYAVTAAAMVAKTGHDDADVSFGGGVIDRAGPTFWKFLVQRVRELTPSVRVVRPAMEPQYGAAVMAGFCAGADPQAIFQGALNSPRDRQ